MHQVSNDQHQFVLLIKRNFKLSAQIIPFPQRQCLSIKSKIGLCMKMLLYKAHISGVCESSFADNNDNTEDAFENEIEVNTLENTSQQEEFKPGKFFCFYSYGKVCWCAVLYFIIWLTDFACCDWLIPGP